MSDLSKIIAAKTKEIQDAGFFRDRVWYEENDTQSLVDSIRAHNFDEPRSADAANQEASGNPMY